MHQKPRIKKNENKKIKNTNYLRSYVYSTSSEAVTS